MADDVRDMYAWDTTAAFCKRTRGKGKVQYNEYNKNDTIAISYQGNDDCKMAKNLKSDLPSPIAFKGLIYVKPEVFTLEEANECSAREEEHHLRMDKASADKSLVKKKVAKLKALFLSKDHEKAPLLIGQATLISSVI